MADEIQNGAEATSEQPAPQFAIQRVYTKDISFETPNSPGIFQKSLDIININPDAFVTTTGFHIGKHHQNYSILEGYNQEIEDKLLEKVNLKTNGYSLF